MPLSASLVFLLCSRSLVSCAHSIISPFVNHASMLTHLRSLYHTFFKKYRNQRTFVLFLSVWIFWKPAFSDTLFLFVKLLNAPQERASQNAQQYGWHFLLCKSRKSEACKPCHKKNRPAALRIIIFCPDHNRVKNPNYQKTDSCCQNTRKIHFFLSFLRTFFAHAEFMSSAHRHKSRD